MSVAGISFAQPTAPLDPERQKLLDTLRENLKNDYPDKDLSQGEIELIIAAVGNVLEKGTEEGQIAAIKSETQKFINAGEEDLAKAFIFAGDRMGGKYLGRYPMFPWPRITWWW